MEKDWRKEIARDSMAFGSILFYVIVMVRAVIGEYLIFVYQLLIAWFILIIFYSAIKNTNQHIARAFVLVAFTSGFYKDNLFTTFAVLLWLFMIGSAFYIKEKKEAIVKGIVLGLVAALISYYLSSFLV